MRKLALVVFGVVTLAAIPAQAQYHYGPRAYYDAPRYDYGYRHRNYGWRDPDRETAYFCQFGSQTPRSERRNCVRQGYW